MPNNNIVVLFIFNLFWLPSIPIQVPSCSPWTPRILEEVNLAKAAARAPCLGHMRVVLFMVLYDFYI